MHTQISVRVNDGTTVSAIAQIPSAARSCLIFAHGAGAGIHHSFMEAVADGLHELHIATLRYHFPYMEKRTGRPDPPGLCHQTVHAAVNAAHSLMPPLPLFAGGKSFGGRMTSQAQAISPLPNVRGLCFFGFPLHPPKKPALTRAEHLSSIQIPMLFLQGSRDAFADDDLMQSVVAGLSSVATLNRVTHADHSFHVLVRSGRNDGQVMREILEAFAVWSGAVVGGTSTDHGIG